MSVSAFAFLLTELRASWTRYTPGDDWYSDGTTEVVIPEFVCYGRKLRVDEKNAAGIEAAVKSYRLYIQAPLHPSLTEAAQLTLVHDTVSLGTFNVRAVGDVLPDGGVEVDVDRLSNQ